MSHTVSTRLDDEVYSRLQEELDSSSRYDTRSEFVAAIVKAYLNRDSDDPSVDDLTGIQGYTEEIRQILDDMEDLSENAHK